MPEISIRHITKTYQGTDHTALKDISFDVRKGELFGLIGPDGAGKTTLFRILATLILPDEGEVIMMELNVTEDYKKLRKHIGYMPGRFSLYLDLTVEENLHFFATLYNTTIENNYDLIRDIYSQLEPFKTRRAGNLSGGMKQKLALCCALIHHPRILLLDEPTTGVDPVSRKEFWEILKNLKDGGMTILVSTPYMDEAQRCDRIALIQSGKILSIDTPEQITDQFPAPLYALRSDNLRKLLHQLRNSDLVSSCFSFGDSHHITLVDDQPDVTSKLREELASEGISGISITEISPNIEDCFIQLMHKEDER